MSTDRTHAPVPNRPAEIVGVRPVERRMSRLAAQGLDAAEIGTRFRRSPAHVERILGLARLPGRVQPSDPVNGALRPVERRLLQARADGIASDVLGRRFLRSPEHIRRVQALADHKVAMQGSDLG
jgi:DNA-binding CsgD family transcriptional regulator